MSMVLPTGIGLRDWADQLLVDFPADGVPILADEANWQDWGAVVIGLPSFADPAAPDPYAFDDWRLWAERLASVVATD